MEGRVGDTRAHRRAVDYFARRSFGPFAAAPQGGTDPARFARLHHERWGFWLAVFLFCGTLMVCLRLVVISEPPAGLLTQHNFILSGPFFFPDESGNLAWRDNQTGTVAVATIAFLVAYVRIAHTIGVSLNLDRLVAIDYAFHLLHLCAAIVSAVIAKHLALMVMDKGPDNLGVTLAVCLAVLCGLNPMLWLDNLARWAGRLLAQHGIHAGAPAQPDPDPALLPTALPISLMQLLAADLEAKLRRLDLGDIASLAKCNPLVVWTKTDFTLNELVEIVGEAILVLMMGPQRIIRLRAMALPTFADVARAADDLKAAERIAAAIGVTREELVTALAAWRSKPFVRDHMELLAAMAAPEAEEQELLPLSVA
jgi:hypothetical protein